MFDHSNFTAVLELLLIMCCNLKSDGLSDDTDDGVAHVAPAGKVIPQPMTRMFPASSKGRTRQNHGTFAGGLVGSAANSISNVTSIFPNLTTESKPVL